MRGKEIFAGRGMRTASGLGLVAVLLALTAAVAGVGFASGSISAAQYQYGKVTICHHTHSKKHPMVTITVSQHAWPAHERHGDTLGACPTTDSTGTTGTTGTGTTETTGDTSNHGDSGKHDHSDALSVGTDSGSTQPSHGQSDDHGSNGNGNGNNGNGNSGHSHK